MTKQELKDMQELGLTPDELTAKTGAASALARGLSNGGQPMTLGEIVVAEEGTPKSARKLRSDRDGTHAKPKTKPVQPGALTKDQVETIYKLIAEHSATKEDALLASTKALDAANRLELYLDSLKAKG